jgi:hypothetical protein
MAVKNTFYIILIFISHTCFAQETVERTRKLTPLVVEKFNVLKNRDTVMHGPYAAYLKKTLIAAGRYDHNKKAGVWTFFNGKGTVCQRFDYSKSTLIYEAPADSSSGIKYIVDDSLKNDFKFSRPIRIGGPYYGYLPYINTIILPDGLKNLNNQTDGVAMELLISPGGRLAEFKLRIRPVGAVTEDYDEVLNVNLKLLKEEDKVFVAAKLNDNPVAVRIIIPCYFYRSDLIRL